MLGAQLSQSNLPCFMNVTELHPQAIVVSDSIDNLREQFSILLRQADLGMETHNQIVLAMDAPFTEIYKVLSRIVPTTLILDWPDMAATTRPAQLRTRAGDLIEDWQMSPNGGMTITALGREWHLDEPPLSEGRNWYV